MHVRSTVLEPAGLDLISSVMTMLLVGFAVKHRQAHLQLHCRVQHVHATDLYNITVHVLWSDNLSAKTYQLAPMLRST
jgi:hypothetical protein